MLSRGSGTLLDSRNMVMQDCKRTPVTGAVAAGRKSLLWSNSSFDLFSAPERSNVTQWVWLLGDKRAISRPGSGTRCSAAPYAPATFLHHQLGSRRERTWEWLEKKSLQRPETKRELTLQMTSRCLLLEKELSCRQWSTSSCQRLHFTWKSVNVCAPPGWRKTAECPDVKTAVSISSPICANVTSVLHQHDNRPVSRLSYLGFFIQNKVSTLWTNRQVQLQKNNFIFSKNGQIKVENPTL